MVQARAARCDAGKRAQCDRLYLGIAAIRRQAVLDDGRVHLAKLEQRLGQNAAGPEGVRALRDHPAQCRNRIAVGVQRRTDTPEAVPCLQQRRIGLNGPAIRNRRILVSAIQMQRVRLAQRRQRIHAPQPGCGSTLSICRATSSMSAIPSTGRRMPCAA